MYDYETNYFKGKIWGRHRWCRIVSVIDERIEAELQDIDQIQGLGKDHVFWGLDRIRMKDRHKIHEHRRQSKKYRVTVIEEHRSLASEGQRTIWEEGKVVYMREIDFKKSEGLLLWAVNKKFGVIPLVLSKITIEEISQEAFEREIKMTKELQRLNELFSLFNNWKQYDGNEDAVICFVDIHSGYMQWGDGTTAFEWSSVEEAIARINPIASYSREMAETFFCIHDFDCSIYKYTKKG